MGVANETAMMSLEECFGKMLESEERARQNAKDEFAKRKRHQDHVDDIVRAKNKEIDAIVDREEARRGKDLAELKNNLRNRGVELESVESSFSNVKSELEELKSSNVLLAASEGQLQAELQLEKSRHRMTCNRLENVHAESERWKQEHANTQKAENEMFTQLRQTQEELEQRKLELQGLKLQV